MKDLSILIPALNEAANIRSLIAVLEQTLKDLGISFEILVMDGGSTDDTASAAVSAGDSVRVLKQTSKGYSNALTEGFSAADGEYILTLDADLSHDPSFVSDFWNARNKAEMIIGSRYVAGGKATMPAVRKFLSRVLNAFFRYGLSLPCQDLSSGFRLYRTSIIRALEIESKDFEILQEILIKHFANGWKILEIPIHYKPRKSGSSHAKLIRFGIAYLRTFRKLWSLRNSISCADYDDRAYDSRIPLQKYWQRRRYAIIEKFATGYHLTLDVGCGSSRILASNSRPVGLDIQLNKLLYARRFGRPLVNASIWKLPFLDQCFDCVICSEVIEHIDPDPGSFLELRRVLKRNGTLVLGTPDYSHRTWRIIEAIYERVAPGGYAEEHITHYSLESLRILLEKLGFRIDDFRYICHSELILKCTYVGTNNEDTNIGSINRDSLQA